MAKAIPIPGYYSTTEALEFFGICKNTLKTWVRHGKLNVMRDEETTHRYYDIAECKELFHEIEKLERSGEYIFEDDLDYSKEFRTSTWAALRYDHKLIKAYHHPIKGKMRYYKKSDLRELMKKMPQKAFQFEYYSNEELIKRFRPTLEKLSDE